jgi:DNA-binding CsgD family transcriptional regulator
MDDTGQLEQVLLACDRVSQIVNLFILRERAPANADWKTPFLGQWCKLVEARAAYMAELTYSAPGGWTVAQDASGGEWISGDSSMLRSRLHELVGSDPGLRRHMPHDGGVAHLQCDLPAAAAWHESHGFREICNSAGLGECIGCYLPTDSTDRSCIVKLFRDNGHPPFGPEDVQVCRIVADGLHALQARERPNDHPKSTDLSARMKEVLQMLLSGDSEKQIAAKIGLSRNTVHHHVKAVYKRFGVNSRPELMLQCLAGGRRRSDLASTETSR